MDALGFDLTRMDHTSQGETPVGGATKRGGEKGIGGEHLKKGEDDREGRIHPGFQKRVEKRMGWVFRAKNNKRVWGKVDTEVKRRIFCGPEEGGLTER